MKLTNGNEVRVRLETDTTASLLVRAVIGLGLWIGCLYLLANNL